MKEENKDFVNWWNSLEGFERRFAANQICIGCSISRPTLSRWLDGNVDIKNPYRQVINMIAGKTVLETKPLKAIPT